MDATTDTAGISPESCSRPELLYTFAVEDGDLPALRWYWAHEPEDRPALIHTVNRLARYGHLHALQWLSAKTPDYVFNGVCKNAAEKGHLEVLQWARDQGYPWGDDACDMAAAYGRLEVLRWALEDGWKWTDRSFDQAAENGRLVVLQWALANGYPGVPWSWVAYAARSGHLEVVEWAHSNGGELTPNASCWARWEGHTVVLDWLIAHGCPTDE